MTTFFPTNGFRKLALLFVLLALVAGNSANWAQPARAADKEAPVPTWRGPNLLRNYGFEEGLRAWTLTHTGAYWSTSTDAERSGVVGLHFNSGSATATCRASQTVWGIIPGRQYATSTSVNTWRYYSGNVRTIVQWWNGSTFLSSSSGGSVGYNTNGWMQIGAAMVAPQGANKAIIRHICNLNGGLYLDNSEFYEFAW